MQPILSWTDNKEEIKEFCQRWKIQELSLFGSVLRNDFGADSDVDFLVSFGANSNWTLFDFAQMEEELAEIIGQPIDLVSKRAIEQSPNWKRKARILNSAQPFVLMPNPSIAHELA